MRGPSAEQGPPGPLPPFTRNPIGPAPPPSLPQRARSASPHMCIIKFMMLEQHAGLGCSLVMHCIM